MQASIRTQQNGSVVAVLDADAARVTFACVMFAARLHDEIVPLARIVEQQLGITACENLIGGVSYAGDASGTR